MPFDDMSTGQKMSDQKTQSHANMYFPSYDLWLVLPRLKGWEIGATTFSITTISIMTLSLVTFIITKLNIMTFSIMAFSIVINQSQLHNATQLNGTIQTAVMLSVICAECHLC